MPGPTSAAPPLAHASARPSLAALHAAASRVGQILVFGALPLGLTLLIFRSYSGLGILHFDFEGTVWEPTHAILDGRSPFPDPSERGVDVGNPAVYPPSVALVGLPFAALPFAVAAALWTAVSLAAVAVSLWLLGSRDWRCHMLVLSSFPVLLAATMGNVTLLLIAAVAVTWVYRDRPAIAGVALGLAVALKLFLWPLVLWLLATKRFRAGAISIASGTAAIFVPWAAIGFAGLRDYPDLLRAADHVFSEHSNSLYAGAAGLGLGDVAARSVALAVGAALVLGCFALARRPAGDFRSLCAALGAALVLTPIAWPHYFALLFVPVAILRPQLHRLWLVAPISSAIFLLLPLPRGTSAGRPADVPAAVWEPLHASSPAIWHTLGYTALLAVVLTVALRRIALWRREQTA